jgi:lipoprotein-anchoring transpeptidase ErfK/SrfK
LANFPGHPLPKPRSLAIAALALTSALSLTACGQLGATNPRLQSIGATGPQPSPSVVVTSQAPAPTTTPPAQTSATPPCPPGPYQLQIEQALAKIGNYGPITVDGKQSAQDCAAFQKRMGIGEFHGQPVGTEQPNGTPGPTTRDVAERIAATDPSQCPYSDAPEACVDLTHQTFYMVAGGVVILGPTVTRTGKPGFSTWPGTHHVIERDLHGWSAPYHVVLPYWQHFWMGQGLHETTTYIHNMAIGSHGCVNLLHQDAAAAFDLLHLGSIVYVYGRRPGTADRV